MKPYSNDHSEALYVYYRRLTKCEMRMTEVNTVKIRPLRSQTAQSRNVAVYANRTVISATKLLMHGVVT